MLTIINENNRSKNIILIQSCKGHIKYFEYVKYLTKPVVTGI